MRLVYTSLIVLVTTAVITCALMFLYYHYKTEIPEFLDRLKIVGVFMIPVFIILSIILVCREQNPVVSTLSFGCLFILIVCSYLQLTVLFRSSTPNDGNVSRFIHLYLIYAAELLLIILAIVSFIQYWHEFDLVEDTPEDSEGEYTD